MGFYIFTPLMLKTQRWARRRQRVQMVKEPTP